MKNIRLQIRLSIDLIPYKTRIDHGSSSTYSAWFLIFFVQFFIRDKYNIFNAKKRKKANLASDENNVSKNKNFSQS